MPDNELYLSEGFESLGGYMKTLIQKMQAAREMIDFHQSRLDCTPIQNHAYSREMHTKGVRCWTELLEEWTAELTGENEIVEYGYDWQSRRDLQ